MEATEQVDSKELKKSRRSFLFVIAAFAIPVLLAKLALNNGWIDYGVTNQGQLLAGEKTLADFGIEKGEFDQKWVLFYRLPDVCEKACEQQLVAINNTYVALGKELPRVTPLALTSSAISEETLKQIRANEWQFKSVPTEAGMQADLTLIYVADPLGNVLLTHQIPSNVDDLPAFGKAIVADMKKLLKYSRIG